MALYGVDFYGASRYGPRVFLDFDASPLVAEPRGQYAELSLSWTTPAGQWSRLRLVRNAFGVPVNHADGAILMDTASGPAEPAGTREAAVRTYLDTNLEAGRFQYYAIYLYVPAAGEWTRAASTTALPLKDFGYSNRLWELTPSQLRTTTTGLLDNDNETLRRFLQVIGTELDTIRAEYETLRDVNDPSKVSGNLLPMMAQQYGQFFEPELGMKQMRNLLRSTVYLYRMKGTYVGVEAFVKAVSGFGAKLQPLKNLVLDYNDSSAEESTGRWEVNAQCTISRHVADNVIDAPSAISPMRRAGVFRITATGANPVVAMGSGPDVRLSGIPVIGNERYSTSIYSRAAVTARSCRIDLYWYNISGTYIANTAGTAAANIAGDWVRLGFPNMQAPPAAAYCIPFLRILSSAANEVHYFDALQVEQGDVVTAYEDARLLDINVLAPRVNLILNPSFENDVSNWTAPAGTLTQSATLPAAGAASAAWVAAPGDYLSTSLEVLYAGSTHTFSIYGAGTGTYELVARGSVGTVEVISAPFTLTGTQTRRSVSWTPLGDDAFVAVRCVSAGTGYWDAALAEAGTLQDYFDGSSGAFLGETLWEGAGNASRSHGYPQRRAKNARMLQLLPEFTPMGSSFRLNYAQTPDETVAKMGVNLGPTFAS